MPGRPAPPAERFWRFVERRSADECWPWVGVRDRGGYGTFAIPTRRKIGAHRFAYYIATGVNLTSADLICHHCDNPCCVNPAHLFRGTHKINTADMVAKGRNGRARRTTCKNGHPFSDANTGLRREGGRRCRICDAANQRAYRARRSNDG